MQRFLALLTLCFALWVPARATSITVSANQVPYANLPDVGNNRSVTVTATSSSTTVTSSAALPSNLVGTSGWLIAINGSDYTVSAVASTSSLTLTSAFTGSTSSYTATIYPVVLLQIYSDRAFTPLGASYVIQPGSPSSPTGFYRRIGCSYLNHLIYIPEITLDSITDAATNAHRQARYSAFWFTLAGARIGSYAGFESFQVPGTPATTTWPLLMLYNAPVAVITSGQNTYSVDQINALLQYLTTSTLTTSGLLTGYVAKTANYTLTASDFGVDCTTGTFTITLPTAVGRTGQIYAIKNSGTGVITLATTSAQTIDGYASGAITLIQYDAMVLMSTGSGWRVVSYS